jgi:hypothetical protein
MSRPDQYKFSPVDRLSTTRQSLAAVVDLLCMAGDGEMHVVRREHLHFLLDLICDQLGDIELQMQEDAATRAA